MKPLWFPMSALLDAELDCWASPVMLRLPLSAGAPVGLRYVGDQMWPNFRHRQPIKVLPIGTPPETGDVLVAVSDGNLEVWRVEHASAERLRVVADARPGPAVDLDPAAAVGLVKAPRTLPGPIRRTLRRAWLEIRETRRRYDERPAQSVQAKYDRQAADYAIHGIQPMSSAWTQAVRHHLGDSGRMLVVGSGTGRECHGLAQLGFECVGIDFAQRMVEQARRLAAEAGVDGIRFRVADVRRLELRSEEFDGVLFTPDVYSFLPSRNDRVRVLGKLREAIAPRGRLLLSARITPGAWARAMLGLQWLRSRGTEPGDSHTRFLSPDGSVHRSFVHCFSARSLRAEYTRAGFSLVGAERAFQVLEPCWDRGPSA